MKRHVTQRRWIIQNNTQHQHQHTRGGVEHVGQQPRELAVGREPLKNVCTKVELVVSDTGGPDAGRVEDGHHLLA
jgi:hypothetical protein